MTCTPAEEAAKPVSALRRSDCSNLDIEKMAVVRLKKMSIGVSFTANLYINKMECFGTNFNFFHYNLGLFFCIIKFIANATKVMQTFAYFDDQTQKKTRLTMGKLNDWSNEM